MAARVALYVDGDNLGAAHAARVLKLAATRGQVEIARVYADFGRNNGWNEAPGFRLCHAGTGKNASDLLLAVEAVHFAHSAGITTHVIASSDGDFTHLIQRLREIGHTVIGLGEAKAPAKLRAVCTEFHVLAAIAPAPCAKVSPQSGITELDRQIRTIIAAGSIEGRGVELQKMAQQMQRQHGVKLASLEERTWRSYLAARPALYELDPAGQGAMVRFKAKGFNGAG